MKKPFYCDSLPYYPFPSNKDDIISEITGSWLEEIKFDDKVCFAVKESVPPAMNCLRILDIEKIKYG